MNLKNAFYFIVSLLLTGGIALAQQTPPPALAPAPPDVMIDAPSNFSFFFAGGSFLGVHAEDISKENMGRYGMREVRGVGITQVLKDSPAEKAGLRKDDVILRFENDSVTSVRKLTRLVSEVAPDQTVKLGISRGGGEQEVAVTVGKRNESMNTFGHLQGPEGFKDLERFKGLEKLEGLKEFRQMMPPGAQVWKWEGEGPGKDGMFFAFGGGRRIGVSTTQLSKQLADYFGVADGKGVLVTSVADDSPAAKAGIRAGDVITAIDGEKVEGAGDLARAINKKKDGDVSLTIVRNKNQKTINVTPKEDPMPTPGAAPQGRRVITIPRVELGSIAPINIQIPRIDIPIMPEINVVVPRTIRAPRVRVIRTGNGQEVEL
ncbi:MAG TPA: PDZ domain-containing protein [Pyrinomonadaceae bacterium]|nr:PDZ domain-containing protein [Pyrinomonadaceae bacterium]